MTRYIGIRHRVKRTAAGQARPTQVVILEDGEDQIVYDLDTETDELDWLMGRFPVTYRKAGQDDEVSNSFHWQLKTKKMKETDIVPESLQINMGTEKKPVWHKVTHVPSEFDGFQEGDVAGMVLGGSGDKFAYALSRRGEEVNAEIYRIPPFVLKDNRAHDKKNDAMNLAELVKGNQELFYLVTPRDRDLIWLRESLTLRIDAMKDRMACGQRLRQRLIGKTFCSGDGRFPESEIEDMFGNAKANDMIYQALLKAEKARDKDLLTAVEALDIYNELFKPIEGVGPKIAARIIAKVGDVRRFAKVANFKAYCGAHVKSGGRYGVVDPQLQFPKRTGGEPANWDNLVRGAGYLFADQANRRPNSKWGQLLLEYKAKFRAEHPEPVQVQKVDPKGKPMVKKGKPVMITLYTNGHIHKMALQRTSTKFFEWLYREWWKIENRHQQEALSKVV